MLIVIVVVQVPRVLLDRVDAQRRRINLLGPQRVGVKMPVDLAFLLAVGLCQPDALDVGALGDEVPLAVRLAGVGLGLGEEVGLCKLLRELGLDPAPYRLILDGPLAEGLLPRGGNGGSRAGQAQQGQIVLHGGRG
jgi:hypothetical protein